MKKNEFAKMLDGTAVQFNMEKKEITDLLDLANQHRFKAVAVLFEHMKDTKKYLLDSGNTETLLIGGCGFPNGDDDTNTKIKQLQECMKIGVGEMDITNNIRFIKTGNYDAMREELKRLIDAIDGMPSKIIIEVAQLTDDEIKRAADVVIESGATFLKTGTGHFGATTLDHVKLIHEHIGDAIQLKVAGGIRDLGMVEAMMQYGVTRFGIGIRGIRGILDECED